jgi:hypothetical protein
MKSHGFTLLVKGVPKDPDGFESFCNALYPHAPDSTPGTAVIGFVREAPTLRDAILSSIESVHRADASVRVVGIEIDEDGQTIDEAFVAA